MKAIQVTEDQSLIWAETSDPGMDEQEVLVEVHAAGVNRADLLQVKGNYPPPEGASSILGLEVAGRVVQVGSEVEGWQVGHAVMALLPGGGYAEKVAIPAELLLPLPEGLDFIQGAAIPEALYTSYYNLINLGGLAEREDVLLHAGAGGIGSTAIQLAKLWEARVIATTGSQDKVKYCQELGADLVLNYHEDDLKQGIKSATANGVDVVLDTIGNTEYAKLHTDVLAHGGCWLLIGLLGGIKAEINMAKVLGKNLFLCGSTLRNQGLALKSRLTHDLRNKLIPAYTEGRILPCVDTVFPVDHAQAAHEHLKANQVKGKLILQIR